MNRKVYRKDKDPRMWLLSFPTALMNYIEAGETVIDRIFSKTYKFLPGDEVFAYITAPHSRIMYRFVVTDNDVALGQALDCTGEWLYRDIDVDNIEKLRVVRMELADSYKSSIYDDRLNYTTLNQHGMGRLNLYQSIVGEKRNILRQLTAEPEESIALELPKAELVEVRHPAEVQPQRSVKTKTELFRELRADKNHRLRAKYSPNGGTDYNKQNIIVMMPDGKCINEKHTIDTFIEVARQIGYGRIADLGIIHRDKYPLITRKKSGCNYKEATMGWFVLSNCPAPLVAAYINDIADALNINLIADIGLK